jgi:hypothetical protein
MSLLSQVSLYSDHTRRTILGPAWSDHVVLATIVSNVRIGVSQDTSSNKTLILSATTATSHNVNTAECPISVSLLPIIYSSIVIRSRSLSVITLIWSVTGFSVRITTVKSLGFIIGSFVIGTSDRPISYESQGIR